MGGPIFNQPVEGVANGTGFGVRGRSDVSYSTGVLGINYKGDYGWGVVGISDPHIGVLGLSNHGRGVQGVSGYGLSGVYGYGYEAFGVYGLSEGQNGVVGIGGTGVVGRGSYAGVQGVSDKGLWRVWL